MKQSLGLAIISILSMVALNILAAIVPALGILKLLSFVILIFWIPGIINATNGVIKPVPVVRKMFENQFAFIQ